jgi:hypothetical protein
MRLVAGALIALSVAALLTFPRIAGIETWKWLLGLVGLSLFVRGGLMRS